MTATIIKQPVPAASRLHGATASAHFHDSYRMALAPDPRSALQFYLDTVVHTPRWVDRLMALRNAIVSRLGLKDLGALGAIDRARPASAYRPGDRIGIFTLLHVSDDEAILGDSDRHLDVQVSVYRRDGEISMSTVVHVHRLLGHVYMLFVAPVHRRIVPAVMRRMR
ncbi:DUF2867 domain-containing protein [Massilia dura]|uniref:DUF2867 domain-containing protein n=1 Tax=Pseudoduganella dura TaxID=321982 RepID=A0A6I3XFH1_9BURK|nr:DUF2867 domain-containing protein [Pseudoduganella dura]MUI12361.1 DUF2867 domain-containing protein [Pseudoduganella dura]GGX99740.1 hypothetical protein GCM10007386_33250 [Pseudoduganella dura]